LSGLKDFFIFWSGILIFRSIIKQPFL
jgi:hypothetical protein